MYKELVFQVLVNAYVLKNRNVKLTNLFQQNRKLPEGKHLGCFTYVLPSLHVIHCVQADTQRFTCGAVMQASLRGNNEGVAAF